MKKTTILLGCFLTVSLFLNAGTQNPVIRVACVGDSITFGAGIKNRSQNSYPAQLSKLLGKRYEVRNFGRNSATMLKKGNLPYWQQKQYKDIFVFKPNIIILMLGTNDTKPENWKYKSAFEKNYEEMVRTFQAAPPYPKVWIMLPVPSFPGKWGISDKTMTEEVIPILKKVAVKTGAGIINAHKALEHCAKLFPDKVHPNKKGAGIIVRLVAGVIKSDTSGGPFETLKKSEASKWIFTARGLHNSAHIFKSTSKGRVVFLGGSITEMNGYRPKTEQILQAMFPNTKFDFINAGIGSTCSTTGAFRLLSDVMKNGKVDMLFVEFAVNDNQDAHHTPAECIRGMEGIARHALTLNPDMDIIFLYTANKQHIINYQNAKIPSEIAAHQKVAEHYNIPTINLAGDVAERIKLGVFDWARFGGCHPSPFGNDLYAADIKLLFNSALTDTGKSIPVKLPAVIDAYSYYNGRFADIKNAKIKSGWKIEIPNWNKLSGGKRSRFLKIPMLCSDTPGAELTLPFKGQGIGVFIVAGPDAGRLDYSIDCSPFKTVNLFHSFSGGLHYPRSVIFNDKLHNGNHTLTLRVSSNNQNKGNAARIIAFEVN